MSEPKAIDFSRLRNHHYVMNRKIFYGMLIFLALVFMYGLFSEGLATKVYAECPGPDTGNYGWCSNPFYDKCDEIKKFRGNDESKLQALYVCEQEYLFAGTKIGKPQSNASKFLWLADLLIILFGVVLNHFLFNRPEQIKARKYVNSVRLKKKW